MVWMRVSATQNFRKLWGVIDEDLEKGTYELEIANSNLIEISLLIFGRL